MIELAYEKGYHPESDQGEAIQPHEFEKIYYYPDRDVSVDGLTYQYSAQTKGGLYMHIKAIAPPNGQLLTVDAELTREHFSEPWAIQFIRAGLSQGWQPLEPIENCFWLERPDFRSEKILTAPFVLFTFSILPTISFL